MFCVECGKEQIFKDGVCLSCYLKHNHFTKGPEVIDIISCTSCSAYKYKNTWFAESLDEAIKRHIKDTFQISNELQKIQIGLSYDEIKKNMHCTIEISGFIDDQKITEEHILLVRIKKTSCDVCSKQFGGYYEAILQLRAENRTPSAIEIQSIQEFVMGLVETFQSKGNRALFITDIATERGGIDFYFSEKGSAFTIAKKIQETYGGEIKQSSTNIGMKDSRQVYRMTYLVRLPAYKTGDCFLYEKSLYFISSIHKNKVHSIKLTTWAEQVFDGKDLQKAKIYSGSDVIKDMIVVSQSKQEVQLMNPKTYAIVDVKKPTKVTFQKKMVMAAVIEDHILLLPEKITIDK